MVPVGHRNDRSIAHDRVRCIPSRSSRLRGKDELLRFFTAKFAKDAKGRREQINKPSTVSLGCLAVIPDGGQRRPASHTGPSGPNPNPDPNLILLLPNLVGALACPPRESGHRPANSIRLTRRRAASGAVA